MALTAALMVQPHLYIGDGTGKPLDYGTIYFGETDKDPEFYPIDIFYDPNLTISAAQPVRTKGGFMYGNGDMVEVYALEQSYSVKVMDEYGKLVFYKPVMTRTIDSRTVIEANSFFIAPPNGNGVQVFEYRDAVDLIWTIVPAGVYLKDGVIAKGSVAGDKLVKGAELNEPVINNPKLTATLAQTTLDAPNLVLAADGNLKTANDPLNASTRKIGIAEGNVVERGADGYPVNNNAIGVDQTWQDVKTSRVVGTIYTNTTGRPIEVFINGYTSTANWTMKIGAASFIMEDGNAHSFFSATIPTGATYQVVSGGIIIQAWLELR